MGSWPGDSAEFEWRRPRYTLLRAHAGAMEPGQRQGIRYGLDLHNRNFGALILEAYFHVTSPPTTVIFAVRSRPDRSEPRMDAE